MKWISVKDALPNNGGRVMAWGLGPFSLEPCWLGFTNYVRKLAFPDVFAVEWAGNTRVGVVTHWAEITELFHPPLTGPEPTSVQIDCRVLINGNRLVLVVNEAKQELVPS